MSLRRREFLATLGALGAATLTGAQTEARTRIDLHHHFASPRWSRRLAEIKRQGWETFQDYKPSQSIEAMDKAGIQTAFLSVTNPGVWFTDDYDGERQTAVALARDMNEFAARMVADYKGRFGLFATLPLRDVDASLREIEYAFDTLKADGVGQDDRSTVCSLTAFRGAEHRARPSVANPPADSRLAQLRKFYFDTAGSANPVTMRGLRTLVGPSQIVYGTDYPFGGANGPANIARNLQRCGFTAARPSQHP